MRIYLPSMLTKKLWQGMFPLLALGLEVPSKSVVLEYVSQNLVHAVFLEPKTCTCFLTLKET